MQTKINQKNKIKQTLNNKNNIFYARKNLQDLCFAFWCFFLRSKTVREKICRLEIVLITSLYSTTCSLYSSMTKAVEIIQLCINHSTLYKLFIIVKTVHRNSLLKKVRAWEITQCVTKRTTSYLNGKRYENS